jgi:outer membrane biosynthesis protein TonB
MGVSKIDFTFENLHFSCKGDNAWVEKQLNNVLSRIPTLLAAHKKGENENVVEDVIEVKAEDEMAEETADTSAPVQAKKSPKEPKEKKAKIAKVKIAKEPKEKKAKVPKVPKIKIAKVPKIKVAKVPKVKIVKEKVAKVPKIKVAKIPKIAKEPKAPKVEKSDSQLAQFITDKKGSTNQVRKFLATAVFLANSSDVSRLSTSMISKALKSDGIEKLKNASDCLNKNEKKGYCIKDGKEFIITENGYLSIG